MAGFVRGDDGYDMKEATGVRTMQKKVEQMFGVVDVVAYDA